MPGDKNVFWQEIVLSDYEVYVLITLNHPSESYEKHRPTILQPVDKGLIIPIWDQTANGGIGIGGVRLSAIGEEIKRVSLA